MHFYMNQSMKRREEGVIRDSTEEFDFFDFFVSENMRE